MRWFVAGAAGMLGRDLVEMLSTRGDDVTAVGRSSVDVTDPAAVVAAVAGHDIVVNCAAWTEVDDAEENEAAAFAVNAVGAANLARAAHGHGARIVQVSTDYAFGGHADLPYDEYSPVAPATAYGRTKAAGEWAVRAEAPDHLVVRTAWLYGAHGSCFPKTIARVARERGSLDVVADQVGQPTWTRDLASFIFRLVDTQAPAGTYHGTSSGQATWFEFARAVVLSAGLDPSIVRPSSSQEFVRRADRPAYSVLGHAGARRAGVEPIGLWLDRWQEAADSVLAREA